MSQSYVRHVELLGFEKRFFPSQHYVYVLLVKWSDQSEKLVYRRYPEVHTLHKSLKEMFPIEAGDIDETERTLPTLAAPKWRESQKTMEGRQTSLSEYWRLLLVLPAKISRCALLRDFFCVRPEDESPPAPHPHKPSETFILSSSGRGRSGTAAEITGPVVLESYRVIADYTKSSKHELSLQAGDVLDIVEKSANGWWFAQCDVRRGWVPVSYLEALDAADKPEEPAPNFEGELHKSSRGYKAVEEDEMTLDAGETVEVIHKLLDGWWVVRKGEDTGFYPAMFLCRTGETKEPGDVKEELRRTTPPPRRSTIRNAQRGCSDGPRISQESYRRCSRRFLQQKGRLGASQTTRTPTQSSLQTNGGAEAPVVPPRPSAELILERCTEKTSRRISLHQAGNLSPAHFCGLRSTS